MKTMEGYLTDLGRETYAMATFYGLAKYYVPQNGNINIPKSEVNITILTLVSRLLMDNPNWCMGYEDDFLYVSAIADLQ